MPSHAATPAYSIHRIGRRSYISGNTFPVRHALGAAGCHWDGERKAWWIGSRRVGADIVNDLNKGGVPAPRSSAISTGARIVRGYAEVEGRRCLLLQQSGNRLRVSDLAGTCTQWLASTPNIRIVRRFRCPVSIDMLETCRREAAAPDPAATLSDSPDVSASPAPQRHLPKARFYAGIGARKTPTEVLSIMTAAARRLAARGYCLCSGAAAGADTAFEQGAGAAKEIWLPWHGFNRHPSPHVPTAAAYTLAARIHPAWRRCSDKARAFHARNMHQILGAGLDNPVDFVLCWTPEGSGAGGTGQALRLAHKHQIPVFDMGTGPTAALNALAKWLERGNSQQV
jgi:hypothetical protein